jgi:glycosyltransferase involved in cell wall biosynthesis
MTGRPDAAIVITNFNYGRFLRRAVDTALRQVGCTVEVIVVDDASTDESRRVLDDLTEVDVIRKTVNSGQGAAMNAGFARSTAPVVIFLDADDELEPDIAQRCARAVGAGEDVAKVQFPMRVIDGSGRRLGRTVPDDPRRLARGDLRDAVLRRPDDLSWQPTSGNAFAAAALRRILPMPEPPFRISADYYLSNCAALLGRVDVLEGVGASYRIHGTNLDHRDHLDLERTRALIERTSVTHTEIVRTAIANGLTPPTDAAHIESVTYTANRLVSLRLEPDRHPIPTDSVRALVRIGLQATRDDPDVRWPRRALRYAWFLVVGIAPRRAVRSLGELALRG